MKWTDLPIGFMGEGAGAGLHGTCTQHQFVTLIRVQIKSYGVRCNSTEKGFAVVFNCLLQIKSQVEIKRPCKRTDRVASTAPYLTLLVGINGGVGLSSLRGAQNKQEEEKERGGDTIPAGRRRHGRDQSLSYTRHTA